MDATATKLQADAVLQYLRRHVHRVSDRTFASYVAIGDIESAIGYAQNRQQMSRPLRDDMLFAAMIIRIKSLVAH